MSIEVVVVGLMVGFYLLAVLALANWRDLSGDRDAVSGEARFFVEREIARVRLRCLAWAILGTAMIARLSLPDEPYRSFVILGTAALGIVVHGVEAVMGRLERRRILRGREGARELSEIGRKLDAAAREDEDRFSEGELEKHEVRERLDTAAAVSRGELDAATARLSEQMNRIEEKLDRMGGKAMHAENPARLEGPHVRGGKGD